MACFIVIFNQLSGGSAMWALAIEIFPLVVGWEPNNILWSLCLLTLLQVGVTFIAGQLLERYGRRSFMLEGQRVIILSLILATLVTAYAPDMKEILYVVIFLQMVGFSLSFGPCSFLIGT